MKLLEGGNKKPQRFVTYEKFTKAQNLGWHNTQNLSDPSYILKVRSLNDAFVNDPQSFTKHLRQTLVVV